MSAGWEDFKVTYTYGSLSLVTANGSSIQNNGWTYGPVSGSGTWGNPYTITTDPYQTNPTVTRIIHTEEPIMKGNGKEYLVFKRGASAPSKAADTEAEAQELAAEIVEAEGVACFIYKAVTKLTPKKRDVEVETL